LLVVNVNLTGADRGMADRTGEAEFFLPCHRQCEGMPDEKPPHSSEYRKAVLAQSVVNCVSYPPNSPRPKHKAFQAVFILAPFEK
jgi:hypothetical protein